MVKGVRPDGRLVGVEGMSDGSHDQLYLALRLASLESWLQSHEPIPFIVDDILLNFDDRRADRGPGGPGRALATDPGPVLHASSPHDRPGPCPPPRDVVFVHELPGPEARLRLGDEAAG